MLNKMFNLKNKIKRAVLNKVDNKIGNTISDAFGIPRTNNQSTIQTPGGKAYPIPNSHQSQSYDDSEISEGILDLLYGWIESGEKNILLTEAIEQMETQSGTGANVYEAPEMISMMNSAFKDKVNTLTIEQAIKYAIENWFPDSSDLLDKWKIK